MGIFGSKEEEKPKPEGLPAKQARATQQEMEEAHRLARRGPRSHAGLYHNEPLPNDPNPLRVRVPAFGKYKNRVVRFGERGGMYIINNGKKEYLR